MASVGLTSRVGNICFHQGLPLDQEKGSYQNRRREYTTSVQRFVQRDPVRPRRAGSAYTCVSGNPMRKVDPRGLAECDSPDSDLCRGYCELGGLGSTLCVGGVKCSCVCLSRIQQYYPDPDSAAIVAACVQDHEDVHVDNPHSYCCYSQWVQYGDEYEYFIGSICYDDECQSDECQAEVAEMTCLAARARQCKSARNCRSCMQDLMREVDSRPCSGPGPYQCSAQSQSTCEQAKQVAHQAIEAAKGCCR
jgi:RHS repeat-associated protein